MFYRPLERLSSRNFPKRKTKSHFRNFVTSGNNGSTSGPCKKILIIQCDFDVSHSANLIASAK